MRPQVKLLLNSVSLLSPARMAYRQIYWLLRRLKQRLRDSDTHPYRYRVTIHGKEIQFSTEDSYSVDWFMPRYLREIHEPEVTALLARLSQDGDDIIDVGANLGWFTCVAGAISEATVHSFEPDTENFQRLCRNVSLNELENIQTNHAAVADSSGYISYWKGSESANEVFGSQNEQRGGEEPVEVKSTTLDDYVEENCQSVGVIKIDVEGGEQKVLEGGSATIGSFHPHIILELHSSYELLVSVERVLSLLPEYYDIYRVSSRDEDDSLIGESIDRSSFGPNSNVILFAESPKKPLSDYPSPTGKLYDFT